MHWSSIFHIKTLCKSNGHWFLYVFISRPSTKVLVIDLSYWGPLQMQWSSIFHIKSKSNGHWLLYVFISRPFRKVLVIDLSYWVPLQMHWSSIFHIKTLFDGMVIVFLKCFALIWFLSRAQMKLVFLSFLIFYFDDMKMTNFSHHLVRSKKSGAAVNTQFRPGKSCCFKNKKYKNIKYKIK